MPAASVSALTRALVSLMTNERTGGPDGFVDLFRRVGLGDVITSWFGGNEGSPILRPHLEAALGSSSTREARRIERTYAGDRNMGLDLLTAHADSPVHYKRCFPAERSDPGPGLPPSECSHVAISPRALNKPEVGFSLEKTSSSDREVGLALAASLALIASAAMAQSIQGTATYRERIALPLAKCPAG